MMLGKDDLVRATQQGDLAAFAALVETLRHPMVMTAYHLTGNAEDAQDLAQEALVEGFRQLHTLRDPAKLRGWLFVILRNKCKRYLRGYRNTAISLEDCHELPTPTVMMEGDSEISSALQRLSWQDREVLSGRYLQDMDYDEIAQALGISIHATRVRCARARERLRAQLIPSDETQTRRVLQHAIGLMLPNIMSDQFVHRVMQEVTPMTSLPPATGTFGKMMTAVKTGLMTTTAKITTAVLVALMLASGAWYFRDSLAMAVIPSLDSQKLFAPSQEHPSFHLVRSWSTGADFSDIAVDSEGHVFALNFSQHEPFVRKYNASGAMLTQWGSKGSGPGQFNQCAFGIDVDAQGRVYVADQFNCRVQIFTNAGQFLKEIAPKRGEPGRLSCPVSTVICPDGSFYVSAMSANRVKKFAADGTFLFALGKDGSVNGEFQANNAISRDAAGNIYVEDILDHCIQKFTAEGVFLTKWSVNESYGMTVDDAGNVYLSERMRDRVVLFSKDGERRAEWKVSRPSGITVDQRGLIYVLSTNANWKNQRILVYKPQ